MNTFVKTSWKSKDVSAAQTKVHHRRVIFSLFCLPRCVDFLIALRLPWLFVVCPSRLPFHQSPGGLCPWNRQHCGTVTNVFLAKNVVSGSDTAGISENSRDALISSDRRRWLFVVARSHRETKFAINMPSTRLRSVILCSKACQRLLPDIQIPFLRLAK